MSLCDFHFSSKVLGKQVGAYVYIPDDAPRPLATFYLLHGLSDDYTGWLRRTSIERYAEKYPFLIVMPDGFRGFYTNNAEGPDYAAYVADELPALIERTFSAATPRESRTIGGLSMGGYGALRIALGYPDRYVSANSHSGAVLAGSKDKPRKDGPMTEPEFHRIFGPDPRGTDHDLLALANKAKASGKPLPALRIDCGTDDHLLADNREFHQKLSVEHEYAEFPGGHAWDYWDVHVQEALAFHAKHLKT